jgi:energy-coupling factor transporter ATP-binding protein EcfA2
MLQNQCKIFYNHLILLSVKKLIAILGEPGQGKSTILKRYAGILAKKNNSVLPIMVELNRNREKIEDDNHKYNWLYKRLPDPVKTEFEKAEWEDIADLIEMGEVSLLLDGFDELKPVAQFQVCELVGQIAMKGNQVIVTSRPDAYRLSPFRDFEILNLVEFDKDQISSIAQNICQILPKQFGVEPEPVLLNLKEIIGGAGMALAKNPMFLSFMCLAVIRRYREGNISQFPIKTTLLINECVEALVEWHRNYKPGGDWPKEYTSSQVKRILAPLALESFKTNLGYIPNDKVNDLNDQDRHFFLNYLEKVRFLEHRDLGYCFALETFREYFASIAIAVSPDPFSVVKNNLHNPVWKHLIIYTSGLLGRCRASFLVKIFPTFLKYIVKIFDPIILLLGNMLGFISANKTLQDTTKKGSEIISEKLSSPLIKWFSNSRQTTEYYLYSILKSKSRFESILGQNLRLVSDCVAETEDYPKRIAKLLVDEIFEKELKIGFNSNFSDAVKIASRSTHVYQYLLTLTLNKNSFQIKAIRALEGAISFPAVRIRLLELTRDPNIDKKSGNFVIMC